MAYVPKTVGMSEVLRINFLDIERELRNLGILRKTATDIGNLDTTYLTSYTEIDPVFLASPAHGISGTQISHWDTAYGWGNHASAGYLKLDGTNSMSAGLTIDQATPDTLLTSKMAGSERFRIGHMATSTLSYVDFSFFGSVQVAAFMISGGTGAVDLYGHNGAITLYQDGDHLNYLRLTDQGISTGGVILSTYAGALYDSGTALTAKYSPIAGSSSIVTVGTITSGIWSGTAIADNKIASALTGKTYNGLTLTAQTTGFTIAGGTASKTLTVDLDATVRGTNTGDQTITLTSDVTGSGTGSFAATTVGLRGVALPTLSTGLLKYNGSAWVMDTNTYLTTETDPVFVASPAHGISGTQITNWDTAYGWGDHASAGYLTTTSAASTYQPLNTSVLLNGTSTMTGGLSVDMASGNALTVSLSGVEKFHLTSNGYLATRTLISRKTIGGAVPNEIALYADDGVTLYGLVGAYATDFGGNMAGRFLIRNSAANTPSGLGFYKQGTGNWSFLNSVVRGVVKIDDDGGFIIDPALGYVGDFLTTRINAGATLFKVGYTGLITSASLTASRVLASDASKGIVALDTATYPSLSELAFSKGVTSAIQPQFSGKAAVAGQAFTGKVTSTSATAGIGYETGAGGAVTQATSKATAFTLSKITGTIQFAADSLASQTGVAAAWTNTAIAATDLVVFTHSSGGTLGAYRIACTPAAGSATITIRNTTGSSLSEAPVFRFAVIKSVVA